MTEHEPVAPSPTSTLPEAKKRRTPKHFSSAAKFTRYIYEVAIRDLQALVSAHTPEFGEPDEMSQKVIDETKAEIEAIRVRMKRMTR